MSECNRYSPLEKDIWTGRVDEPVEPEAYRWHQVVELLNLREIDEPPHDEGKPGFCFLGFRSDEGIVRNKGRKGAGRAPNQIRKEIANFSCNLPELPEIYDAGDIHCWDRNLEQSQRDLSWAVKKILSLNLLPIILGGGHEVAFGHYNGLVDAFREKEEKPEIGILNFDSHFDLRPPTHGPNSGTMFAEIAEKCKKEDIDFSYFVVGIQKYANTVRLFKKAEEHNVDFIYAKDIRDNNLFEITGKIDKFIKKNKHIYLSLCTDVFSAAVAPGVSAPQPFGLQAETGLKLIKHVASSGKLLSFDVAEVSPRFDKDNRTAKLVGIVIFAIINTLLSSREN